MKTSAKRSNTRDALRGFDNDSGMTMLRIGSMNLMLHGIESPQFFYKDTLSKTFDQERDYDVILMNPPFKGAVDKNDLNEYAAAGRDHQERTALYPSDPARAGYGRALCRDCAGWGAVWFQPGACGSAQEVGRGKPPGRGGFDAGRGLQTLCRSLHRHTVLHPRGQNGQHLVLRYGRRWLFAG